MLVKYPWTHLKPGDGFFVPTLMLEKTREEGLRASIPHRIRVDAKFVIKDGFIGVWFQRKLPSPS